MHRPAPSVTIRPPVRNLRKIKLHWWILIGIGIGALLGGALNRAYYTDIAAQAQRRRTSGDWSDVAATMTQRGVTAALVASTSGAPIGIVTDHDIRSRVVAAGKAVDDRRRRRLSSSSGQSNSASTPIGSR